MPSFSFVRERITRPCNGRDVARWPAAGAESGPDWFSLPLTELSAPAHRRAASGPAENRREQKRHGADPGAHGNIM